jgi:hypothetical protein
MGPPPIYFLSNFTVETTSYIDKPLITEQLVEFISDPLSSKVRILGLWEWDNHQSISCPILVYNQLYILEISELQKFDLQPVIDPLFSKVSILL